MGSYLETVDELGETLDAVCHLQDRLCYYRRAGTACSWFVSVVSRKSLASASVKSAFCSVDFPLFKAFLKPQYIKCSLLTTFVKPFFCIYSNIIVFKCLIVNSIKCFSVNSISVKWSIVFSVK